MINKIIATSLVIFISIASCKSLNYMKEEDLREIQLPFEAKNFPNTNESFFSIENAKGTNLSVLRNMVQMQAKVVLANALKFEINSITEQRQSGSEGQTSASFQQKATSIIDQSIEKIILVDSKTLKMKDDNQYDYWAVYRMDIQDVVRNLNQQLGTKIKPEDLSVSK